MPPTPDEATGTFWLAEESAARVAGPHGYAFCAGAETFAALMAEEPGAFFVADFLAWRFDRLLIRGLGLNRFPELRNDGFRRCRRLVYLAQTEDVDLMARRNGRRAARARARAPLHRASASPQRRSRRRDARTG